MDLVSIPLGVNSQKQFGHDQSRIGARVGAFPRAVPFPKCFGTDAPVSVFLDQTREMLYSLCNLRTLLTASDEPIKRAGRITQCPSLHPFSGSSKGFGNGCRKGRHSIRVEGGKDPIDHELHSWVFFLHTCVGQEYKLVKKLLRALMATDRRARPIAQFFDDLGYVWIQDHALSGIFFRIQIEFFRSIVGNVTRRGLNEIVQGFHLSDRLTFWNFLFERSCSIAPQTPPSSCDFDSV